MYTVWGLLAGLFELVGSFPYLIAILKRQTRPSRATWIIWSIVAIITFVSYHASGAQETLWQPGVAVFFNLLFAILSFTYGTGGKTKADILCFIGAVLSLSLWYITSNPVVALTSIVITAAIGSVPTIIKSYRHPELENTLAWSLWTLAATSNLLAIRDWHYAIVIYPLQAFLAVGTITILVVRKRLRQ